MTSRGPRKPALWQMIGWASELSGVSLELGLCVVLGWWGDRYWGTGPWLLVTGSVVGLIVSIYHLWQLVLRMDRKNRAGPRR